MNIIVDENIPLHSEAFGTLGQVTALPGRSIRNSDLQSADALIVRSITQVNQALLRDTPVKFVGSCTIGTDHIDLNHLQERQIRFANAPGCNANSVVEYVFCALAALGIEWAHKQFAIIGCGNVGGALARRLNSLGLQPWLVDPALDPRNTPSLVGLEQALQADIICLHTPLVTNGPDPTYHLIGARELTAMAKDATLLNAGRGAVIDNQALLAHLIKEPAFRAVLDVWAGEPEIAEPLLRKVALGTPHIAGYSYDGKVAGTKMVYEALCEYLQVPPLTQVGAPKVNTGQRTLNWSGSTTADCFGYLRQCFDIKADDKRLRSAVANSAVVGPAFDHLRKTYPQRREFSQYHLPNQLRGELHEQLVNLGFRG